MFQFVLNMMRSNAALAFAWLIEIIAVFMGFILAAYAAYEIESKSSVIALIISMLPFIALSIIELTKIPLVALAFKVHSFKWRCLALIALLCITTATFENFIFGFERGFEQRLLAIKDLEEITRKIENEKNNKNDVLNDYENRLKNLESQMTATDNNIKELQLNDREKKEQLKLIDAQILEISNDINEIESKLRSLDQRENNDKNRLVDTNNAKNANLNRQIEEISKQITSVTETKDREYYAALVKCNQESKIDPNAKCYAGNIQTQKKIEIARLNNEKISLNQQFSFDTGQNISLASERQNYNNELDTLRTKRTKYENDRNNKFEEITLETQKEREKIILLRSGLDYKKDELINEISKARSENSNASFVLNDTYKKLEDYKAKSQMHRLSSIFYGNSDQTNLDKTKNIFIISLSVIVALLGTVVATMHYASLIPIEKTQHLHKIIMSLRGLIMRYRKKNSIIKTIEVEKIVEVEKVVEVEKLVDKAVYVDRVKLIYLAKDATEEDIAKVRAESIASELKDNLNKQRQSQKRKIQKNDKLETVGE